MSFTPRLVRRLLTLGTAVLCLAGARSGFADSGPAPFDLMGPSLRVSVMRASQTLPIGSVPNLAPGDKVTVEALMPPDESAHYVLVSAFLRDPINPPPSNWFRHVASWREPKQGGGPIILTVPNDAQHLVLFFAPSTTGDFTTLRKAVMARPGAFIRAAQDLEQASLDRSRYDAYLRAIRDIEQHHPDNLTRLASDVAQSLRIKINADCLQRQLQVQAACLLDARQTVVLSSDGTESGTSIANAATNIALSLSATPTGGMGFYSPYISTIQEIVGLFGAMHTAKYHYIPALGVAHDNRIALVLNSPPSFSNPKSVLMLALAPIAPPHPPAFSLPPALLLPCLGAGDPPGSTVIPMSMSPLAYATNFAHDWRLLLHLANGTTAEIPLVTDVTRGALVALPTPTDPLLTNLQGPITGSIQGKWGFDALAGPDVSLEAPGAWRWQMGDDAHGSHETSSHGVLSISGAPASCVTKISIVSNQKSGTKMTWSSPDADTIDVKLPAQQGPGKNVTLAIAGPPGTAEARLLVAAQRAILAPEARVIAHDSSPQGAGGAAPHIDLTNQDEIATDSNLSFTLKTNGSSPDERFGLHDALELNTPEEEHTTRLTFGDGLALVDSDVLVASLIPAHTLGASAFGPLRARVIRDGAKGTWQNVGTLVRLPKLTGLTCPSNHTTPCTLSGSALYLLASVARTPDFDNAITVADGFPGFTLTVPHPTAAGVLYVRLHDAPEIINRLVPPPTTPTP